ncbi:hypothetical protein PR048_028482 [Dryococelus australis]|uniref:Uncharacterized protein n=1 Tax=Dryococelus australis TaxID=614101 RepID=A0ABQ9GEJ6_9NEOP|nr:hypothetical protein PR048_028482 [Dryococelus australis]
MKACLKLKAILINRIKVCRGTKLDKKLSDLECECLYNTCSLVVSGDSVCKECKKIQRTLRPKLLQLERKSCLKRLSLQLSPRKSYVCLEESNQIALWCKDKVRKYKLAHENMCAENVLAKMEKFDGHALMEKIKSMPNFPANQVALYKFIRDNNILSLPCVRTICCYLALVDTGCSFDPKFFEPLKKKFSN